MKISTRQFFESAHRLSDYEEDCKRVHGHNWVVDIDIDSDKKLNKTGFLIDFKEIKKLTSKLDHSLLVKDTEENRKYFSELPESWVVWLEFNPTCENIAKYIKEQLAEKYNIDMSSISVKVYETYKPIKTSYAEV